MKRLHFRLFFINLIISVVIFNTSCNKEDVKAPENDPSKIDLGQFDLLPESFDAIPYQNKTEIIFIDSFQTETTFKLEEFDLFYVERNLYRYNVFELGDTIIYKHRGQKKLFYADNGALGMRFTIGLKAEPYDQDPSIGAVADILKIGWIDLNNLDDGVTIFIHEVNIRTFPESTNDDPIEEKEFIDKLFYNVFTDNFPSPKSDVYYNFEFGIVAFTDKTGKLWRFKEIR